jgi:hypothetical protein
MKKVTAKSQNKAKKKGFLKALLKIKKPVFNDRDYQDYLEMRKQNRNKPFDL